MSADTWIVREALVPLMDTPRYTRALSALTRIEHLEERNTMSGRNDLVRIPQSLLARLMAAVETPGDLTDEEITHVLGDADEWYPHETEEKIENP